MHPSSLQLHLLLHVLLAEDAVVVTDCAETDIGVGGTDVAGGAEDSDVAEGSAELVLDGMGGSESEALAAAKVPWSGQVTLGEPAVEVSRLQPPMAL